MKWKLVNYFLWPVFTLACLTHGFSYFIVPLRTILPFPNHTPYGYLLGSVSLVTQIFYLMARLPDRYYSDPLIIKPDTHSFALEQPIPLKQLKNMAYGALLTVVVFSSTLFIWLNSPMYKEIKKLEHQQALDFLLQYQYLISPDERDYIIQKFNISFDDLVNSQEWWQPPNEK